MAEKIQVIMERQDTIIEKNTKKKNMIEAQDVKVHYDDFMAIKGIDMKIKANKVTAFIGPSGCGKSTFLRLFNRMNDYVDGFRMEGEISIHDENIYTKKVNVEQLRKEVGMVFQKPNPFPKTIYDNVAFGPRLHYKLRRHETDELVERALRAAALWDEVKDRLRHSALGLSGG